MVTFIVVSTKIYYIVPGTMLTVVAILCTALYKHCVFEWTHCSIFCKAIDSLVTNKQQYLIGNVKGIVTA